MTQGINHANNFLLADGDGMIFSLAFKDGRAYFRNKFVKTKGFLKEQVEFGWSHRFIVPWFMSCPQFILLMQMYNFSCAT